MATQIQGKAAGFAFHRATPIYEASKWGVIDVFWPRNRKRFAANYAVVLSGEDMPVMKRLAACPIVADTVSLLLPGLARPPHKST